MSTISKNGKTWTAGKPKKKPDYDCEKVTKELLDAAVEIYEGKDESGERTDNKKSLRSVAEKLEELGYGELNPAKVKKLLITARAYKTPTTERIQQLHSQGHTVEDIMKLLNLSKAAVNNNLPYEKVIYKMDEIKPKNGACGDVSVNADRVRRYKKRKKAMTELKKSVNGETLWKAVLAFEEYSFETTSGLPFTYEFKLNRHGEKGNELCVSRKSKSITRSCRITIEVLQKRKKKIRRMRRPVIE